MEEGGVNPALALNVLAKGASDEVGMNTAIGKQGGREYRPAPE